MSKIVFLNGRYVLEDDAKISVFDRGFLLADGVYEVVPVVDGKLIDLAPFFARFAQSLSALKLDWPMSKEACLSMFQKLIDINHLREGGIYMQVTRGVAPRVFEFPQGLEPTCMAFAFEKEILHSPQAQHGVRVVTVDDIRWRRRDIKSIALLGQSMAREEAVERGAYEGWMVEEGFITEGTSSSAYLVKDSILITRPLSRSILPGIRRKLILELAPRHGIQVKQRPFTPEEAYAADEAFLSSATTLIYPIIEIDGHTIGDGQPGPITRKLRELYIEMVQQSI
jgi:D-alanine transaminase